MSNKWQQGGKFINRITAIKPGVSTICDHVSWGLRSRLYVTLHLDLGLRFWRPLYPFKVSKEE